MSGQDLIKVFKQYPIATVSLIVAAVAFGTVYFRWMGQPDMQSRLDSLRNQWVAIETNVFKNSVNLEEHLEYVKTISQDARDRFINRPELGRNYRYFYGIENETGVRITALEQLPPPPPAPQRRGRGQEREAPPPVYSGIGYSMTIVGTYRQVLSFLHALENGQHFYRLNTMTLQPQAASEHSIISAALTFDVMGNP